MPRPNKSRKRSQNAAALSASVIKKQKNEKTCGLENTDNESSIDMSDTSVVSSNNGVGETGEMWTVVGVEVGVTPDNHLHNEGVVVDNRVKFLEIFRDM